MALIISSDEIKKTIPGYNPAESHIVHEQSAKIADKDYKAALVNAEYPEVILLSGGAASGKTEFMSEYLVMQDAIIVDGTLPSVEGAMIKVKAALKNHKKITVAAIWPTDLVIAFGVFLQRTRKFPDEHFYRTHSQSRKTLLTLAESDLPIDIELYMNQYENDSLSFYGLEFSSRRHLIEFLKGQQYTEQQIIDKVIKYE